MRLMVDGVVFQFSSAGDGRAWRSLLTALARLPGMEVLVLDRGGLPAMAGVTRIPFPSYAIGKHTAADSLLIDQVARSHRAEIFLSTLHTTPVSIPSITLAQHVAPAGRPRDEQARAGRERALAIAHARRHLCVSQQARRDLLGAHPELSPAEVGVAFGGVDPRAFFPRPQEQTDRFLAEAGIGRPFVLLVGTEGDDGDILSSALAAADCDVARFGGEGLSELWIEERLAGRRRVAWPIAPSDDDLATAYGAASALVQLGPLAGFGLSAIEAMACGCPVVTTRHEDLAEMVGDAALVADGSSGAEIAAALTRARDPAARRDLSSRGLTQAARFGWGNLAGAIARAALLTSEAAKAGAFEGFHARWAALRQLQADVDVVV